MRALITKGGAASPYNAAEGLADEERKSTAVSANTADKNLPKHVNGKSQNVKNVTWGANMVQEYQVECNDTLLQEDVDMSAEDAGDALEVQEDTNPDTPKQHVPKHKVKSKPCQSNKKQEVQYVPKV